MFKDNKYKKWYLNIINKAKSEFRNKKNEYYENHHIIPKSMGGKNTKDNLVLLTPKEHFICHLLLCKMTEGESRHKMINAFIRMSFSKSENQQRYTSKSFSLVRKFIAIKNSEKFKGIPKSDEVKSNMKNKSGTWKRTPEYIKNLSDQRKGKNLGANNHFFGKKHTEETKLEFSKKRKGSTPPFNGKGTKWYTNGIDDKMCFPDNIPDGFKLGRTKNRKG